MKKILMFLVLLINADCFAQGVLESSLKELSSTIAKKMQSINKKRIAVIDLTEISKAETVAGKYIADVISINLLNDPANFQLYDRQNLDKYMKEMKLNSEGYIDEASAKQLGKLLSVDAIVSGNYTVLQNKISITLKVFDSETAFLIAGAMIDIPFNDDTKALLGLNSSGSRGFNGPVQQGENYNNPQTVSPDCKTKDIGDFCFENKSPYTIMLNLSARSKKAQYIGHYSLNINILPGESKCAYTLPSDVYDYAGNYYTQDGNWTERGSQSRGQIMVEQCKSKTQAIR